MADPIKLTSQLLAQEVLTRFADGDGLTHAECAELGFNPEQTEVLTSALKGGSQATITAEEEDELTRAGLAADFIRTLAGTDRNAALRKRALWLSDTIHDRWGRIDPGVDAQWPMVREMGDMLTHLNGEERKTVIANYVPWLADHALTEYWRADFAAKDRWLMIQRIGTLGPEATAAVPALLQIVRENTSEHQKKIVEKIHEVKKLLREIEAIKKGRLQYKYSGYSAGEKFEINRMEIYERLRTARALDKEVRQLTDEKHDFYSSREPYLRQGAIQALARIVIPGNAETQKYRRETIEALLQALYDYPISERQDILEALGKVGADDPQVTSVLRSALASQHFDIRESALIALGNTTSDHEESVRRIRSVLKDPNEVPTVRREAARTLGRLDTGSALTIETLIEATGEKDGIVSDAAVEALVKMGHHAIPRLIERLNGSKARDRRDEIIRMRMAHALGRILYFTQVQKILPPIPAKTPGAGPSLRDQAFDALVGVIKYGKTSSFTSNGQGISSQARQELLHLGILALPAVSGRIKSSAWPVNIHLIELVGDIAEKMPQPRSPAEKKILKTIATDVLKGYLDGSVDRQFHELAHQNLVTLTKLAKESIVILDELMEAFRTWHEDDHAQLGLVLVAMGPEPQVVDRVISEMADLTAPVPIREQLGHVLVIFGKDDNQGSDVQRALITLFERADVPRDEIMNILTRMGMTATPTLLQAVQAGQNVDKRKYSIRTLAKIAAAADTDSGYETIISRLTELLADATVRDDIKDALAACGKRAISIIISKTGSPDLSLQSIAGEILVQIGKDALLSLADAAKIQSPEKRRLILKIILKICTDDPSTMSYETAVELIPLLDTSDLEVAETLSEIFKVVHDRPLSRLIGAMAGNKPYLAANARKTLIKIGRPAINGLIALLDSKDDNLRKSVEDCILAIGEPAVDFLRDKYLRASGRLREIIHSILMRLEELALPSLLHLAINDGDDEGKRKMAFEMASAIVTSASSKPDHSSMARVMEKMAPSLAAITAVSTHPLREEADKIVKLYPEDTGRAWASMTHPDSANAESARSALWTYRNLSTTILPKILKDTQETPKIRDASATLLAHMIVKARLEGDAVLAETLSGSYIPLLIAALEERDPVGGAILDALAKIGKASIRPLLRESRDIGGKVASFTPVILYKMGTDAVSEVLTVGADETENKDIRLIALEMAGSLHEFYKESAEHQKYLDALKVALPSPFRSLASPDPVVATHAAIFLDKITPLSPVFFDGLKELMKDQSAIIRSRALDECKAILGNHAAAFRKRQVLEMVKFLNERIEVETDDALKERMNDLLKALRKRLANA